MNPGQSAAAIGLSTYAFLWRMADSAPRPLTVLDVLAEARRLGATVLQITDYPRLESLPDDELVGLRRAADDASIRLELGTSGLESAHLLRYLDLATRLGASFVRTMSGRLESAASRDSAISALREVEPEYARRGVSIGLETYEAVATRDLVAVVEAVASPSVGITLDPANCVARLEYPAEVIDLVAPYFKSIHVKDFVFARQPRWVGFALTGCLLGEGLLDYPALVAKVHPGERGISQVLEHWLPPQGTPEETSRLEQHWTERNFETLRKMQ